MARGGSSKGKLSFNQQLTGIPSGEQLKRLHELHEELAALDQEVTDTKSLDKVKDKLINAGLLLGKDKGVKAYTCCCLADLLRLYAPDCPYGDKDLKNIFQFFIRQLKYLTGPASPNYAQYFYLIESLSTVKSATLIPNLPGAEQVMSEIAKQFFDLAKPDMPKNLLSHVAEVLIQIIDEASQLPSELVDVLLAQFLPKNVKANPTSLGLAVEVCNQTAEKLQRYIAEYFTEVLVPSNEDEDDEDVDSEPETTKSTKKGKNGKSGPASKTDDSEFVLTHDLIKCIARTCPQLLANVIPLIEEELVSEDTGVRILASRTLGDMFSDKPTEKAGTLPLMLASIGSSKTALVSARADLAKKYPQTWKAWLGRSRDKSPQVRQAILECSRDIIEHHHELGRDVYDIWKGRFTDPDDKIRATACAAFQIVDYESSLHVFGKDLLLSLAERIQDRKPAVQKEALNSLGRMYNNAFNEISNGESAAIDRFCWIPQEILKNSLLPDRHLHASTERILHDYILPLPPRPEEESYYVDRLLLVMHYLDIPGWKALLRAARLFDKRPLVYETYLDVCERYNGGNVEAGTDEDEMSRQLQVVCRLLAPQFPEPVKAGADLHKFAKLNDHRTMKLLRTLMDPSSEGRTICKNVEEVLKRIEKASSGILETFAILIRRSGFLLINRSTIPHLLERLSRAADLPEQQINGDDEEMNEHADEQVKSFGESSHFILENIIKNCPVLLKAHVPQLCEILLEQKHEAIVDLALHGLSSVVMHDPASFVRDSAVLDKAFEMAMYGSPVQAKYAATFLAAVLGNEEQCDELVKNLADALPVSSGQRLISHLNALKRLAKYAVDAFETRSQTIATFATAQLKRPTLTSTPNKGSNASMDIDIKPFMKLDFDEWCADEDFLPEHQACLLGIQMLTNRVYALAEREDALEIDGVTHIFKVLGLILAKGGKPSTFKTGPGLPGRLRLTASISLLKLGTREKYHKIFMEYFENFAWTMQDPSFQVRSGLVHKFIRYSTYNKMTNPRMNTALFLTAHDPDIENRLMPQKYIVERLKTAKPEMRLQHFELLFVRLIHLLAHHPDFSTDVDDLRTFARYLEFFLDCIATRENVALLYYLALKCKTIRDSKSPDFDNNIYTLAELAQYVIKSRASIMGWQVEKYPGQIRMPSDIFKPLSNAEVAIEIRRKVYISTEDIEQIGSVGKPVDAHKKPRQTKKTSTNGTGTTSTTKSKTHAGKTSTTSADDSTELKSASKVKARSSKVKTSSSFTNGRNGDTKTKDGELSRKRKKGLEEWEDDTEDEEEDLEDEDEEVEDKMDDQNEDVVEKEEESDKEEKARPSNLRQRPTRTSLSTSTSTSSATAAVPTIATKPVSKGKGRAKARKQVEEDDEEEMGEAEDSSTAETTMDVDEAQTAVHSTADSSKENDGKKKKTAGKRTHGHAVVTEETESSPKAKRRKGRDSESRVKDAATIPTKEDENDPEQEKEEPKKTSPSPGKRRSRRGAAGVA